MITNNSRTRDQLDVRENVSFPTSKNFLTEKASGDISILYMTKSLEDHELPVVGTFVHSHILPGFRYRVRLIGANEYLFDRRALKLESIGKGYGKRITFESDDVLENDNFFWSDSNDRGFAFSIELLSPGEVFEVHDGRGLCVGSFSLDEDVGEKQRITDVTYEENLVNVHAEVNVSGSLWLFSQSSFPAALCEKEIPLKGSGIAMVNRLTCTMKLLETGNVHTKIFDVLDIKRFIKQTK